MLWQEWSQQGSNAMGKLVADVIVVRAIPHGRGGDVWEMVKENFL
jgi:hypothetical protein